MKTKYQLYVLVSLLLTIGLGAALYKHLALGFTFLPSGKESVWQLQAKIHFDPTEGPVTVKMTLPEKSDARRLVLTEDLSEDYQFTAGKNKDGVTLATWTKEHVDGKQNLYLRGDFYYQPEKNQASAKDDISTALKTLAENPLNEVDEKAAQEILQEVRSTAKTDMDIALSVVQMMNDESEDSRVKLLLEGLKYRREQMEQAAKVLALVDIPSKVVRGIRLQDKLNQKSITTFIKIADKQKWVLIDPRDLTEIPEDEVILWPEGTRGLLDVYGGENSSIHFSVSKTEKDISRLAIDSAKQRESAWVNFSIYSLPIKDQNTFKLLLLIPIGALVVVILRNLVGIRTSGTFMPILIALTFMQTSLLLGLVLFLVVVSVGLVMRSYLSHLNLLLVPRIASVLVFVIFIFAAIGIVSHKVGWESGLTITFFPMIILSWTIERMSVLWEEEGPNEVFVQGGGSLFTAVIAYLVMTNNYVEHLTYNFPELLLVLLAIIIMIGSYSGFRLSELGRFEPMTSSSTSTSNSASTASAAESENNKGER